MKNCVSIYLKNDKIVIKIAEEAEQRDIMMSLNKKISELKNFYK